MGGGRRMGGGRLGQEMVGLICKGVGSVAMADVFIGLVS
jgi:hypothetical protein